MDEKSLSDIFRNYKDRVFGFFIKNLGHRDLAQDLTQDLFYKLCRKESNLSQISDLDSYIFLMCKNMVYDHLRKAAHQKAYKAYLIQGWKNQSTTTPIQNPEIERKFEAQFYHQVLEDSLENLTPQQKLIFTLSKKEGLSNQTIAEQLELSQQTVKNHLSSALKVIRSTLNPNIDMILCAASLLWELFL